MAISENAKPLLEEYGQLRAQKNACEKRMKELDVEVRPLLYKQGAIVVGDFLFELRINAGRKTLDQKAMIADGIDVESYKKVGAPINSLHVKALG